MRKYDFGVLFVETVFTRAVMVQADDPKLSAEMTEVPSGNTIFPDQNGKIHLAKTLTCDHILVKREVSAYVGAETRISLLLSHKVDGFRHLPEAEPFDANEMAVEAKGVEQAAVIATRVLSDGVMIVF